MKFTGPDAYLHIGWFPAPETVHLQIPDAPDFLCGLKALFITDVHLRRHISDDRLHALAELIHARHADIAFLGGDYGETGDQIERFFSLLDGRSWPLGCFAVPGNNDREVFPDAEALRKIASDAHVQLLVNETQIVRIGNGSLQIGGCDEYKNGAPETGKLFSDPENSYRILLSHFPVIPECEAELMLSGHTHGGQFNVFGITPYSVGFEHKYRIFAAKGFLKTGNLNLLISSGIGASRLPLRIGARPQIHILEFVK